MDPDGTRNRGLFGKGLRCYAKERASLRCSYEDVPEESWYADGVDWAEARDLIPPSIEGVFEPEKALTREEAAVFLFNYVKNLGITLKEEESLVEVNAYEDAAEVSAWAEGAVAMIQQYRILEPREANQWMPQAEITQAEVAMALYRLEQVKAE